ncbi:hypothetical protein KOW79_001930 [Hemibagrus wyckioides]|uniref:Uncharacterized protein n=1 Tax=Hemibagrus wyckioides TaxID=337641 RepID=A0A9D3P7B5_9TELE|nr:hypothetical protein KOW79_001930 [Hemibagrus wyckioides]
MASIITDLREFSTSRSGPCYPSREMGDGRKSGSSGLDAMWFVSGLHSYAHDPGLCSNRQMSAKTPCPGVGDRSGGRRASGDQRVKPCGRVLS